MNATYQRNFRTTRQNPRRQHIYTLTLDAKTTPNQIFWIADMLQMFHLPPDTWWIYQMRLRSAR